MEGQLKTDVATALEEIRVMVRENPEFLSRGLPEAAATEVTTSLLLVLVLGLRAIQREGITITIKLSP